MGGVIIIFLILQNDLFSQTRCDPFGVGSMIIDGQEYFNPSNFPGPIQYGDVCEKRIICGRYVNPTMDVKTVTITIYLLPDAIIHDLNGFQLVSTSPDKYEKVVVVPGWDGVSFDLPTITECIEFSPNPSWNILPSSIPVLTIETDCQSEGYYFGGIVQIGDNGKYIDATAGPLLLSDAILNNFSLGGFDCTGGNNFNRLTISGELIIDIDYCIRGTGVNLGVLTLTENASITVNEGVELTIRDIHVKGCDNLWESIFVKPGASLTIMDAKIEDAYRSVHILDNYSSNFTNVMIANTDFTNNYTGVYSEFDLPYVTKQKVNLMVAKSSFSGDGLLKPTSFPITSDIARIGLQLGDLDNVILAGSSSHPINFKNLNTGLTITNTNISFSNTVFENMVITPGAFASGTAIKSQGNTSGLYFDPLASSSIKDAEYGIEAIATTLDLHNIEMVDVDYGIHNILSNVNNINHIENCQIYARFQGVRNIAARPYQGIIKDNLIDINNDEPTLSNRGAIISTNGSYPSSIGNDFIIENNLITVRNTEVAIGMLSSERHNINKNNITYLDKGSNAYGIRIQGGDLMNLACNRLDVDPGSFLSNTAAGIQVDQSLNPIISCNSIYNYSFGSRFTQSNAMTDFKGNLLDNSNEDGLYIDFNSIIGQQLFKGNRFPSKNNPILYEARNFNTTIPNTIQSQFQVNSSNSPDFLPNWFSGAGSASDWFLDNMNSSISDYECTYEEFGEDCHIFEKREGEERSGLMNFSMNEAHFDDLEEETQHYILLRQLLKDFDHNARLENEDYDGWIDAISQGDAFKVHLWETELKDLLLEVLNINPEYHIMLTEKASLVRQYNQSLLNCLSDGLDCVIELEGINIALHQLSQSIEDLAFEYSDVTIANILQVLNQKPDVQGVAASIELNALEEYINFIVDASLDVVSDNVSELENIASLCPNLYGPGVYTSRGLLLSIDQSYFWLDEGCTSTIEQRSTIDSNDIGINSTRLYPTIGDGMLTVELSGESNFSEIIISDLSGRLVHKEGLENGSNSLQLNVSHLKPGAYIAKLATNQKEKSETYKFFIY